jgi:hypothetical protein
MINEQLGMIDEQLQAEQGLNRVNLQDPYSFAPQQYANEEKKFTKIGELFGEASEMGVEERGLEEGYSEKEEISKLDSIYNKAKQLIEMHESMDYPEDLEIDLIKELVEEGKDTLALHGVIIA